jgi:hypothetical protein
MQALPGSEARSTGKKAENRRFSGMGINSATLSKR